MALWETEFQHTNCHRNFESVISLSTSFLIIGNSPMKCFSADVDDHVLLCGWWPSNDRWCSLMSLWFMSCIDLYTFYMSFVEIKDIKAPNSVVDPHDNMTCVPLGGGFCKFHVYSGFKLSTYCLGLVIGRSESPRCIKVLSAVQVWPKQTTTLLKYLTRKKHAKSYKSHDGCSWKSSWWR